MISQNLVYQILPLKYVFVYILHVIISYRMARLLNIVKLSWLPWTLYDMVPPWQMKTWPTVTVSLVTVSNGLVLACVVMLNTVTLIWLHHWLCMDGIVRASSLLSVKKNFVITGNFPCQQLSPTMDCLHHGLPVNASTWHRRCSHHLLMACEIILQAPLIYRSSVKRWFVNLSLPVAW